MAADASKSSSVVAGGNPDEERPNDDDYHEQECRSETGEEELTEAEMDTLRRELLSEVTELEWEFKQAKESLYNERISQVESKLSQARAGTAPEFMHVVSLVEKTYRIRREVADCRRNFAIEVANKEMDNELQIAQCTTNERLLVEEEQIRLRLQESLCRLQIERATMSHQPHSVTATTGARRPRSSELDYGTELGLRTILSPLDTNFYLPSPDLEPRKKPVSLSPSTPRLVYQLPEEDIRADVEAIMAAVKEHKMAIAMAQMNGGKLVC